MLYDWHMTSKNWKKKKDTNNNSSIPILASDIFLPSFQDANAEGFQVTRNTVLPQESYLCITPY